MIEKLCLNDEHPIMITLKQESVNSLQELLGLEEYIDTLTYSIPIQSKDGEADTIQNDLPKGNKG